MGQIWIDSAARCKEWRAPERVDLPPHNAMSRVYVQAVCECVCVCVCHYPAQLLSTKSFRMAKSCQAPGAVDRRGQAKGNTFHPSWKVPTSLTKGCHENPKMGTATHGVTATFLAFIFCVVTSTFGNLVY